MTVLVGRGVVVEKARRGVEDCVVVDGEDDGRDGEGCWIWERHRRVEAMREDDEDREVEAARAVNEGSAGAMMVGLLVCGCYDKVKVDARRLL